MRTLPLFLTALVLLASLAQSPGAMVYSRGHGDLVVLYADGQLEQGYRLEAASLVDGAPAGPGLDEVDFAADQLITLLPDVTTSRPSSSQWNFTGVAAGSPLWLIPEVQDSSRPWLGLSTEELVPNDWVSFRFALTAMSGPAGGHFALAQTGTFGAVNAFMATADGIGPADRVTPTLGSHAHYNWIFTQPGIYQLTFTASGEHVNDGLRATTATYTVAVGQVPEPGSASLALTAAAGLLARRLRRRSAVVLLGLLVSTVTHATSFGQGAGLIEFESASYVVNEQAASRSVTVRRVGGSSGTITVNYATADGTASAAAGDYVATSGTLVFAPGETEKVITVQIASDTTVEAAESFTLSLSAALPVLGPNAAALFTINDPPTIGTFTVPATPIGTATAPIAFTIADPESAAASLSVTAFSTNPVLLPPSGIVLGGSAENRTLTLTPAPGLAGTASFSLLVTDPDGAVAVRNLTLAVGPATAATAIALPAAVPSTVVLTADDSFTLNYTITNSAWVTTVTRSNTTLFNAPGTGASSDLRTQPTTGGTARTLRIRPSDLSTSAGRYGLSTVTLGFTGAGAPAAQTFDVRVNPRAVADNNLLAIPGTTSTFDVLANDVTPLAGHTFTITSVSAPSHGTLAISDGGKFVRYTPTNTSAYLDTFTYTVTVSSSDAFNGYQFTGIGYVRLGGYLVLDSPTASQHIDLDFDYAGGVWRQIIRTDAVVGGSVQSGTFSPSVLDADEGVVFLDPTTKQPRPAATILDALGVPAGADVWVGPSTSSGNRAFIGIASESTTGVEAYLPVGDPRANTSAAWIAIRLVGFSGPGHFAAFDASTVSFDTFDGLNSPNDDASGDNVSDTFWGLAGSHAHPAWYFTAPGRYALTFQTTVRAGGAFVSSPPTTFYFDVDTISGPARLPENPPLARSDVLLVAEDASATVLDVLANDSSEADGYEVLTLSAVGPAGNGSTSLAGDGRSVSYTPNPNFHGVDTFTYTCTDEHGGSATSTVAVTVSPVNDAPVFVKGPDLALSASTLAPQTVPLWATAIGDGDPLVAQTLTFTPTTLTGGSIFAAAPALSADGTLTYQLNGTPGTATISVILTDDPTAGGPALSSAPQTFTITAVPLSPLAAWRQTYFGTTENAGAAADSANPDGDAFPNLLEWAFGLNPTVSTSGELVISGSTLTQRGGPRLSIASLPYTVDFRAIFCRRQDYAALGLTYAVQFTADLVQWETSGATPVVIASDGEIDAVSVPYPFFLSSGRKAQFFRVVVTTP